MARPVKLDCATIRLIAAAIAEGRVTAVEPGRRALPPPPPGTPAAPPRPEGCGSGRRVGRAPALHDIDGDRW